MDEAEIKKWKKVYSNVNNQSREHFIKTYHWFREVMCSTKYTIEQKENTFDGLATDYLRCNLNKNDIVTFKAICLEWEMRKVYE